MNRIQNLVAASVIGVGTLSAGVCSAAIITYGNGQLTPQEENFAKNTFYPNTEAMLYGSVYRGPDVYYRDVHYRPYYKSYYRSYYRPYYHKTYYKPYYRSYYRPYYYNRAYYGGPVINVSPGYYVGWGWNRGYYRHDHYYPSRYYYRNHYRHY